MICGDNRVGATFMIDKFHFWLGLPGFKIEFNELKGTLQ